MPGGSDPGEGSGKFAVAEIGTTIAVRYAGRLLKTSGLADVFRHEPAIGENASPLDRWLDDGKACSSDRDPASASIIIIDDLIPDSDRDKELASFRESTIDNRKPHVLVTLVGTSPDMRVSDLLLSAASGAAWPTGLADREPLYGFGHRLQYGIGLYLVIAALGAASVSIAEGRPAECVVDARGVVLSFLDQHAAAAAYSGFDYHRNGTAGAHKHPSRIYGEDGDAAIIYCVREEEWFRLAEMIGLSKEPEFEHLQTEAQRLEHAEFIDRRIETWLSGLDYRDVMRLARQHRVPMAPACKPELALSLAKEFISKNERARSPSAWLKEDADELPSPAIVRPKLQDLRGLRVVEMSTGWSMPLVGRVLAHLGAEVIKIESHEHFDSWRGSKHVTAGLHRYPGGLVPADPVNMNAAFNVENVGKLSATLNLRHAQAGDVALRLLSRADIFIENHRPGALAARGLGRDAVRAVAPRMSFLSISACGQGIGRDLVGWGPTVEAIAGATSLIGYPDDARNLNTGYAIIDPLTGLHALCALLTDMAFQGAAAVDMSMLQAALESIPEPFIDERWNSRLGNGHPDVCPHGIYPTADPDEWLAILCTTDQKWTGLVRALGLGDFLDLENLTNGPARIQRRADIDAAILQVTSRHSTAALTTALATERVEMARVRSAAQILQDPVSMERQFTSIVDHPSAGSHLQPRLPLDGDLQTNPRRSYAPSLGEDNDMVWKQIAGLSDHEYQTLLDAGVFR